MMTVTWKDSASGCAEVPTAVGYFRFHTRLSQVDGDWLFGGGETERVKASGYKVNVGSNGQSSTHYCHFGPSLA